jgi:protein SCO1/2
MRVLSPVGAVAVGIICLLLSGRAAAAEFKGGLLAPSRLAPDLALSTQDGKEFRLSRERGKVVAVWFGYTHCPDVCPTTLAELSQAQQRLGKDAWRFRVIFVTVDPECDTPARLREYVSAFSGSFTALTGPSDRLAAARKAYGDGRREARLAGDVGRLSDRSLSVRHTSWIRPDSFG